MPRISRELSQQKKDFVIAKFQENPNYTIREIQEFLKVKFAGIKGGETMNPATVLELRKGVDGSQTSPIVANEPPDDKTTVIEASGTTTSSTETIVTPRSELLTQADVEEAFATAALPVLTVTREDDAPSPVVQVAAPKPQPAIVPEEGVTYIVDRSWIQVTDEKGTCIRKAPVAEQPVAEA